MAFSREILSYPLECTITVSICSLRYNSNLSWPGRQTRNSSFSLYHNLFPFEIKSYVVKRALNPWSHSFTLLSVGLQAWVTMGFTTTPVVCRDRSIRSWLLNKQRYMGCNNIRRPWGGCWAHGMETLQGSLHVTFPHSSQTILLPFITVTTRSNEFL